MIVSLRPHVGLETLNFNNSEGPLGHALQDWAKAGSHEQPSGSTLQRRKDRVELLRDTEPGPAVGGTLGPSGEEAPRPRMSPATIAAKVSGNSLGSPTRAPPSLLGQLQEARQVVAGPAQTAQPVGGCLQSGLREKRGARLQPAVLPPPAR